MKECHSFYYSDAYSLWLYLPWDKHLRKYFGSHGINIDGFCWWNSTPSLIHNLFIKDRQALPIFRFKLSSLLFFAPWVWFMSLYDLLFFFRKYICGVLFGLRDTNLVEIASITLFAHLDSPFFIKKSSIIIEKKDICWQFKIFCTIIQSQLIIYKFVDF